MAIGINADYGMEDIAVRLSETETVVVKVDVLEMAVALSEAYNDYAELPTPKNQLQETDLLNKVFEAYGLPKLKPAAADALAIDIIKQGAELKKQHRAMTDSEYDVESPDSSVE